MSELTSKKLLDNLHHHERHGENDPWLQDMCGDAAAEIERLRDELKARDMSDEKFRIVTGVSHEPPVKPAFWILDDNGYIAAWYTYDPIEAGKEIGSGKLIPLYAAPPASPQPPAGELDPSKLTSEELWRLADRMGEELVKRGELRRAAATKIPEQP